MSIKVSSQIWEHSKQSGGKLLVLLAIADFARDDGYAFPAVSTLAKKARMTKRNVQLCLVKLCEAGELEVAQGQGPKGCNLFRVKTVWGEANGTEGVKDATDGGEVGFIQPISEPSKNRKKGARKRAPDVYGLPARAMTQHLHDTHHLVFASEYPLMEGFSAGIGHFKRLLKKLYPGLAHPYLPGESHLAEIVVWWMEKWNNLHPGYERSDFSAMAFVQGYSKILTKWEEKNEKKTPGGDRRLTANRRQGDSA